MIAASLPTRREVLKTVSYPLVFGLGIRRSFAADPPPNIVFIMADDLGYADLSCYGRRDYRTPNIDRIAAGGMKFTQAYANSPVCSATRTSLLTGRYQYRLPIGLEEPLSSRNVGLPPGIPTLPSLLKKVGYGSALIGKWHLGRLPDYGPLQSGYEHFWGFRGGGIDYFTHKFGAADTDTDDLWEGDVQIRRSGYLTDLLGERAVNVVGDYARLKKPFLLSLHFNAPHWPWEAPGDEAESKRLKSIYSFDGGSMQTYARMVTQMDFQVGRVLQALDTHGIANHTIVIFTSDNGGERFSDTWPFSGKKTELLEGGLRVPALIRWPRHIKAGSISDQVTITMDWMPTLLALAGAAPDRAYAPDGISLVPTLTHNAAPVSRKLYWRYKGNVQRAVRDGDMKWLKIGDNTFLFNLAADPLERANLKNRQPEVFARLAADYQAWEMTMLCEDPESFSDTISGASWADHYGNKPK
jgi:arylsulfatase A-like enzyme